MSLTVYANPRAPHQVAAAEAICQGMAAIGRHAVISHNPAIGTKEVAVWGWRKGSDLRARGHDVLVIERGYIGDRHYWQSLGWNGLNNRAQMPDIGDPARFEAHFSLEPITGGDYALLIGQVAGDMSLQGRDLRHWYADMARQAAAHYRCPVVYRPHPVSVQRGTAVPVPGTEVHTGDLLDALHGAKVVITYNSNAAVEAVMAGKPTITVDRGSMAWDVTGHEIGEKYTGAREDWAHRLAWKQWTLDEIASGDALEAIYRCR